MMERRSRRASLRSTIAFSIGDWRDALLWARRPVSTSAWTCLGEELSLGFEPVRIGVARQGESASPFRNEISANTNLLIQRLGRFAWLLRDFGSLVFRRRILLVSGFGGFLDFSCSGRRPRL